LNITKLRGEKCFGVGLVGLKSCSIGGMGSRERSAAGEGLVFFPRLKILYFILRGNLLLRLVFMFLYLLGVYC